MDAIKATIGEKYLSKKGTPVTVVGHKGDKIILKVAGSDNEVPVATDYELKPYDKSNVSKEARQLEQSTQTGRKPRGESVATMIDPLLFAGGKTVKEIAELVTKKAGELAKGKDMEANVRARMVTHSRKGCRIERNERKQVRVVNSKN
ncbi:MAG: hypothetical protein KCHDKBKB_01030 [Elusimicrobia bacterium]|nr:hypothetical protein [Elusimicrobiota bacterium]